MEAKNGVVVSLKTITPELAEEYLQTNSQNRKLQNNTVLFYLRQMKDGNWMSTGDTIKLTKEGKLIDGQHRLHALVKYGKPVKMFVAENLDQEAFDVLDTGKQRTASDVLSANGTEKANHAASIIRAIILFQKGLFSKGWHKHQTPTNADIHEFSVMIPDLAEIISFVTKIYRDFRYMPISILGALYFLFSKKNQEKADQFFYSYSTGIDLQKTSPVYLLRDRLIRDKMNKTHLKQKEKIGLFITAWNAFVTGKEMQRLKVNDEKTIPEIV